MQILAQKDTFCQFLTARNEERQGAQMSALPFPISLLTDGLNAKPN
jgi:hypothetical protein